MRRLALLLPALALFPWPSPAAQNPIGMTRGRAAIQVLGDTWGERPTLLLIGGLDGSPDSAGAVRQAFETYAARAADRGLSLIAIPIANPEGAQLSFPPTGPAYRENPEAHALWRWIGVHAPDEVLIADEQDFGLAEALAGTAVAGVGKIPATRTADLNAALGAALGRDIAPSEAHREIDRRRSRTPETLAAQLAAFYGHDFDQVTYLPGMALIGRMRLGDVEAVEQLARPYLSNPPAIRSSLNIAGHLVFAEIARRTGDTRYRDLVVAAADLGFDDSGDMLEAMPLHNELSDAYFMSGPLLAAAGDLTGDRRYFDMAARHLAFMEDLVLRSDGLYRHSPLTEAAWSRANAFPALGLALTLSGFPDDHPAYPTLVDAFHSHMEALRPFQDADGMWHEVIDYPASYAELSATAMIATAMLRGVRHGWLESEVFLPMVEQAWKAVSTRTGSDGILVDVSESTNKQASLDAYLDREAILGRDPRGGGMVLMFATEMAGLE